MSLETEIAALTKASNDLTQAVIENQNDAKSALILLQEKTEISKANHQSEINALTIAFEQMQGEFAALKSLVQEQWISTATTLTVGVGQQFPTLQSAWDSLTDKILAAPVTIQLTAGVFMESVILSHHPYAHHITLLGAGREQTILQKPADVRASTLSLMNVRGLTLAGITIKGRLRDLETGGMNHDEAALSLYDMSYLLAPGGDMAIEESWTGARIDRTSYLYAPRLQMRRCREGVLVDGGRADIAEAHLEGLGRKQGFGVTACHGGMIFASKVQVSGFHLGLNSERHGTLLADESQIAECEMGIRSAFGGCTFNQSAAVKYCTWGYRVDHTSTMHAFASQAVDCDTGYHAAYLGQIYAANSKVENCALAYQEEVFSNIETQQLKTNVSPVEWPLQKFPPLTELAFEKRFEVNISQHENERSEGAVESTVSEVPKND